MAYISFQPKDYFSSLIYTGTTLAQSITGVGFTQDFTWIKCRDGAENHALYDTVRGAEKTLRSNNTAAETTDSDGLTAFDSNGFTTGAGNGEVNDNAKLYVTWNWKAGTTSGLSGGTLTPSSYSINTTSGIGIYKYSCTGANATIAHGLSSAPKMLITKSLGDTSPWAVWHSSMAGTQYMVLNTDASPATGAAMWNSTIPTDTLIHLGTDGQTNGTGKTNVLYAFSEVKGYSKFGSYTGNGNVNGPFIYTGFKPAYIMFKNITWSAAYRTYDNKRDVDNVMDKVLNLETDAVEATGSTYYIDSYSNGFKIRNTGVGNYSAKDYAYMVFAESPIVSSNDIPGTAR